MRPVLIASATAGLGCHPNVLRYEQRVRPLVPATFRYAHGARRLSQVRYERRPNSTYASLEQCSYQLRRAEALYRAYRLPVINSSAKSVEEMSTIIL